MMRTIEAYTRGKKGEVEQLLHKCGEKRTYLRRLQEEGKHQTQLAYVDEKLSGVWFFWGNVYHPYCTYMKLVIKSGFDKGSLIEIWVSKRNDHGKGKPLQTMLSVEDKEMQNLLKDIGFQQIRRTYLPIYSVENLNTSKGLSSNGCTLKAIRKNLVEEKQLIAFVKATYSSTHQANPVATLSDETWQSLIYAEDLVMEASYVYQSKSTQAILAYSFLHKGDDPSHYEFGWCGVKDDSCFEQLQQLIDAQIKWLNQQGAKHVSGEFDTTNKAAMSIYHRHTPPANTRCLVTLRKES
ncbi:hypothetical protein [Bacillus sp. Marseille-P3800]|uniref:hypothetical protein n=1 Tax=Bacillus sp. Marseille-P3800 TaxID=2014782 RepID=UPI000C0845EC|nr:hypothetical protein [Bacillus sp. Marseille-P3800]